MTHCNHIIDQLRQRGYRITPQREMVIETIAHTDQHMSAEEIYAEVEKRTHATNLATVYRTMELLWKEGFARRNILSEGKTVYATRLHGPHIHLVCRKCNRVMQADLKTLEVLEEELLSEYNFAADLHHISIFGCCSDCQDKP